MCDYILKKGKSAEELFENSEIGRFITLHLAREYLKEATKLYILDFVKMAHKTSSSKVEMVINLYFLDPVCFLIESLNMEYMVDSVIKKTIHLKSITKRDQLRELLTN